MYKKFLLVSFAFLAFYLATVFLTPKTVFAFYPNECGSGSYTRGDCQGVTTPKPNCGASGEECCQNAADAIYRDTGQVLTTSCSNYCALNIGPVIYGVCPVDPNAFQQMPFHYFCCNYTAPTPTPTPIPPTPTPTIIPCSGFTSCNNCIFAVNNGGPNNCGWTGSSCQTGTASCPVGYSQWYWTTCAINECPVPTTPPTPTPIGPTPTPGPLYMIYGTVYDDKNGNGAYDSPLNGGTDVLYDGTKGNPAYVTITNGPPTGTYSINSTGYYGTLQEYVYNTLYTVTLQNIPANCYTSATNPKSDAMPNSDWTINFPLICGGPPPTPTNTPSPTPTPPACTLGVTTFTIQGTVTKTNGNGVNNATACLNPITSGTCSGADQTFSTPANGSFNFNLTYDQNSHSVSLDPASLPPGYSPFSTNPVTIPWYTCSNTPANFTISTGPTPTPTPPLAGPTATPAPPTPTSGPPPPSCNYVDPPANSPAVTLEQNGHTLDITYSLSGVTNPSITFYRNTSPGFYETSPASATLFSTQFGNQASTFHTDPQSPANYGSGYATYYNYQLVKTNSEGTTYSNSSSVAVRKPNLAPCGGTPYGYNPGTISGANEITSTDTSLTFDLSYAVNSSSFFGCSGQCYPSVLPPYLQIQRGSSSTPSYIPFNSYQSLTPTCTSQGIWNGWFGICTTTTWKARYNVSLPPAPPDNLTVASYDNNYCNLNKFNGSTSFPVSTLDGQAPDPSASALTALQATDENGNPQTFVNLNWTPTQDAVDVQAYYTQGSTSRWTPGIALTSTTPVWNGSAWVSTATDDLRTLPTGTYYYGAQVNYAFSCGPVQTDQTAFNWAGQFYTVSGNVFVDTNKNRLKDPGEQNYTGAITISSSTGSVAYQGNGNFKVDSLPEGTYTISYTSLPTGYQISYPVNGPPPSFDITVGTACSVGSSNSAACIGQGDIKDLNFGITNLIPWIQSVGLDLRIDSGFNDYIPSAALQPYASILGSGGSPGIIFSGANSYDLGQGQASPNPYNWIVGGFTYPEIFVPKQLDVIQTSYTYQIDTADKNGLTPTDIATFCTGGIGSCTLSSVLPHGLYIANGNLTIDNPSYTFGSNQNYLILVNGDLTINGNIAIPNGSTVTFSVSGNIYIDKSVTNIQGYYSADGNFTAQGINNCAVGSDVQLKVEGSVVTNAGLGSATFQNQRDLCANNTTTPAVQFIERPDFIINAPQLIQFTRPIQKEVAP